jgi:hypothetical protein
MTLRRASRGGFVLATMLCCLTVLVAFLGIAVDASYLEFVRTRMQTAADAAALGGALEIKMNGAANVVSEARGDAALNGFTNGQNGVTVTVNNPPSTGYSTADSTGVEVIISQQVSPFFMSVLSSSPVGLQARAVAHRGNGSSCLVVISPNAPSAFVASGGATLQASCGIMVDSSASSAFKVSGGATITATTVGVDGGVSITGGATVTPAPVAATPLSDPLASVPAPAVGACTYTNTNISGGATKTLGPGVYCNGITISGGSSVTFSPGGVYILKGGGLNISGGSTATGNGLTFYNTQGGGYSYAGINISGGAGVTLSAPTTGSLAGMLMFQDRSISSSAANSFSGGTSLSLTGALYFSTTPISYSGGTNSSGAYTIIVAKTATFSGGSEMGADYSSLPGGSPVKGSAVLSE